MKEFFDNPTLKKEIPFSNIMAEKIIRVEQNASAYFGKDISYNQTAYFRSLSSNKQRDVEKFINGKKKRKVALISLIILPLFFLSFMNISFTGDVVRENTTTTQFQFTEITLIILFLTFALIFGSILIVNRIKEKKINGDIKIFEDILMKKRMTNSK